ncbi:MAG: methionine adenosyltransferase domain-containing protein [Candidatus Colwellbacteria bacterium]
MQDSSKIRKYKEHIEKSADTFEFVSPNHPDKICDILADSILDAYLEKDQDARVAVEVMGGHGRVAITGEITSKVQVDIEGLVKEKVGDGYRIDVFTSHQSSEIARGVDTGGAGDQGIMIGYACSDTDTLMPKGYEMARNLCMKIYEEYPYDGKVQVSVGEDRVFAVVASFQNTKSKDLEDLTRSLIEADRYFINPAGEWATGGFEADSGLSGRKLVIDNYGPGVPIGGGSFSGKDPTKVDRSGAYMARKVAVDLLRERGAKEVLVKLAYVIGIPEPVMAIAKIDGALEEVQGYDLTPGGIIENLDLKRPKYSSTAPWGHFGGGFSWDL